MHLFRKYNLLLGCFLSWFLLLIHLVFSDSTRFSCQLHHFFLAEVLPLLLSTHWFFLHPTQKKEKKIIKRLAFTLPLCPIFPSPDTQLSVHPFLLPLYRKRGKAKRKAKRKKKVVLSFCLFPISQHLVALPIHHFVLFFLIWSSGNTSIQHLFICKGANKHTN